MMNERLMPSEPLSIRRRKYVLIIVKKNQVQQLQRRLISIDLTGSVLEILCALQKRASLL